jgi:hypothetical protein
MRETRLSGSEGGGIEFNRFSLPLSTFDCRPFPADLKNKSVEKVPIGHNVS